MSRWWYQSVENGSGEMSKWWKIFRATMMKFGRKIFFTRDLYNSLGILQRSLRDLPDSFHEILPIIYRLLVLIIFVMFREKIMKYVWFFFTRDLYNNPETLRRPCRDHTTSFTEIFPMIYRLLLLIIFVMSRAKMMKSGRQIFSARRL